MADGRPAKVHFQCFTALVSHLEAARFAQPASLSLSLGFFFLRSRRSFTLMERQRSGNAFSVLLSTAADRDRRTCPAVRRLSPPTPSVTYADVAPDLCEPLNEPGKKSGTNQQPKNTETAFRRVKLGKKNNTKTKNKRVLLCDRFPHCQRLPATFHANQRPSRSFRV